MTGKYTLIFDGNFWLHKTFFIGQKIKQGKPFNFIDEPEQDKNLLLWKLATDFSAEIKRFEGITNRIVYTVDSSSWRKTFHPESDYKANRTKSSDIDWNRIYEVHNEFIEGLKKMGVVISRIKGAEADDLIFAWSSHLNQLGQNSMIISGDNDLLQLVNRDNSSGANTLYYNKFDKDLHVFSGFREWIAEDEYHTTNDIFNLPVDLVSNTKSNLREIIKFNKMSLDEVNTNEFIFRKILIGDAGDNVSPLEVKIKHSKVGQPRKFVVTEKQANEILQEFISDKMFVNQSHFFIEDHINQIVSIAKKVIKIERIESEIRKKWELNRNLVFLHKNCIPQEINEAMFSSIAEEKLKAFSALELNAIMNKDQILKNTTYTKEKAESFTESTIFKANLTGPTKKTEVTVTDNTESGFNDDFWKSLLK